MESWAEQVISNITCGLPVVTTGTKLTWIVFNADIQYVYWYKTNTDKSSTVQEQNILSTLSFTTKQTRMPKSKVHPVHIHSPKVSLLHIVCNEMQTWNLSVLSHSRYSLLRLKIDMLSDKSRENILAKWFLHYGGLIHFQYASYFGRGRS